MIVSMVLTIFPSAVSSGDFVTSEGDIVYAAGFAIISLALTVYRAKKYIEARMEDLAHEIANIKAPIIAAVGGGAMTFTAQNLVSIFGLVIAVSGIVISVLQYKEVRRRNRLYEMEVNFKLSTAIKPSDSENK